MKGFFCEKKPAIICREIKYEKEEVVYGSNAGKAISRQLSLYN